MVLAVILGLVTGCNPVNDLRFDFSGVCLGVFTTIPIIIFLLILTRMPFAKVREIFCLIDQFLKTLFRNATLSDLAIISLLAGLGEETFFRGWLQTMLIGSTGTWIGLLIASLIFGIAHLVTPLYAVIAAFYGLYLGFLYIYFDNILVVILSHALYDFAAFYYFKKWFKSPAQDDFIEKYM